MSDRARLLEVAQVFLKLGTFAFGGPAAQIALMHREIVEERGWISEDDYLSALSFCMLLPGPEAMQLATWIGWRKHGTAGGLIAGGLFVLPGALVVLALSMIYAAWGRLPPCSATRSVASAYRPLPPGSVPLTRSRAAANASCGIGPVSSGSISSTSTSSRSLTVTRIG